MKKYNREKSDVLRKRFIKYRMDNFNPAYVNVGEASGIPAPILYHFTGGKSLTAGNCLLLEAFLDEQEK